LKISLDLAVKRVIDSLKVTLSLFAKAEHLKEVEPSVYDVSQDKYIINPKIEIAYLDADKQVDHLAIVWRLDQGDIVSMVNDLKDNRLQVEDFLRKCLSSHALVIKGEDHVKCV
jgi:hypothetical protein